jgi:autotransporter-associated beta strand protein
LFNDFPIPALELPTRDSYWWSPVSIATKHRAALYGCASLATLALFVTPSHAEQQLFNFFINGAASNDVTNPAFGGPQTTYSVGCCRSYRGRGQGPHDAPVIPGGFQTTSSGPGAMSEARAVHGTQGHAITGTVSNDAYDGYGVIGFRQAGGIVVNYGGLTVTRAVDATHGPDDTVTPITVKFANAGVANAARWVDTFTNTTGASISGSAAYFTNLGSDVNTRWVASNSGNLTSSTGNRWLTSIQQGTPSDPVNTQVLGNNAFATTTAQMIHADGSDKPEWQYPLTVAPGQTKIVILFNVLTADLNYGAGTVAADIALGGQLANLITNNGAPISADSAPFAFFSDLTRDQLMSVINYDFVGLTIDTSRPFFIETDYAVTQTQAIFDGGTLKPTTAVNFNQAFLLNAAGGTIDNSNGNLTFNGVFSGIGMLNFAGSNSSTLNAVNTYTGATNVNGGTLVVNGSIATSSLTSVNTGGTLAGTGTVGNTLVAGGTFAPGNGTPGSSMTVAGSLAFTTAGIYMVQVNPATSSFATVTGTAALNSAKLSANFAPGTYVARQYTILTATDVTGTFASVTNTNLPAGFTTTTSTDTTHAYLNLSLSTPKGINANQQNVANALSNSFNAAGGIPMVYGTLTAGGLTVAAGELGTGTQQTTNQAMNIFLGLIGDPSISGRGDGLVSDAPPPAQWTESDERAIGYTDDGKRRSKGERDAYAAMYKKAVVAPVDPTLRRWSVWSAGFGGSLTTDGNAALGSNTVTSRIFGGAVGVDYRFSPFTLAGVSLAGGQANSSVANGLGSGRSDLFQAGAFLRHEVGPAYVLGALAYGWQDVTTDRTLFLAGVDRLRAQFQANAVSGRIEGGYRFLMSWMGITPYAAGQFTTLSLPAYAEQVLVGTPAFALAYAGKDVTFPRSELGLRGDKSFAMHDAVLTLRGRAAWAHDYNVDRNIAPSFLALPASSFVVNGAAQARDSALVTAAADVKWTSGWSVAGTFDGEFSNVTNSYSGKGVVRYSW